LNVYGVNDIKQIEKYTAEPQVPEPGTFEVEMVLNSLKDTNHHVLIKFQQKLLKHSTGPFALRTINFLILFGRRDSLRSVRSHSLYLG
jgi:hypothetical protein